MLQMNKGEDKMEEFTSLFLENLFGGSLTSLSPSSITSVGATTTSSIGENLMDSDIEGLNTLGSITTSVATSVSLNGEKAYEKTMQQLETTQAYVESLSQTELEELIAKLELKEMELSINDEGYPRKLKR